MVGARRRRAGTRHINVERRNATDTRTACILQVVPSEHSKCPSGIPYVQQAWNRHGSTGKAVKQTSGTCRNAKHPEPKTRTKPSKRHRGAL